MCLLHPLDPRQSIQHQALRRVQEANVDEPNPHIPFVICTHERLWMLGFDTQGQCQDFISAMETHASVEQHRVVLGDWSLIHDDLSPDQKKINRTKTTKPKTRTQSERRRCFVVYLSNGEILGFTDGTMMNLNFRMRVMDIQEIHNADDDDDGVKPSTTSIALIPHNRSQATTVLEWDSFTQFEKWKFLLTRAVVHHDLRGERFQHKLKQVDIRKKMERKRRSEKHRHRRQRRMIERRGSFSSCTSTTSSALSSNVDHSNSSTVDSFRNTLTSVTQERRTKKKKKQTKSPLKREAFEPKITMAAPPPPTFMLERQRATEPLMNLQLTNECMEGLTPRTTSTRTSTSRSSIGSIMSSKSPEKSIFRGKSKSNKDKNVMTPSFERNVPGHDSARIQMVHESMSRQCSREAIPIVEIHSPAPFQGTLLIDLSLDDSAVENEIKPKPTRTYDSLFSPVTKPKPKPILKSNFEKQLQQAGLLDLHHDLEHTLARLTEKMGDKRKKKLHRQIIACAQAIEHFGTMLASPPLPNVGSGMAFSTGDWITHEPLGGQVVRHWIHKSDLDRSRQGRHVL